MDFQNRPGAKTGSAGPMTQEDANQQRKEWQKKLVMDTFDVTKDPYLQKNHLGSFQCRLCLTQHMNETSYMAHTQGKKHQTNLARRIQKDQQEKYDSLPKSKITKTQNNRKINKIGRPGFRVVKQMDPETKQKSLLFEVDFTEGAENFTPQYRIMSSYEQKLYEVKNNEYQFLLIACDPYETIAFKIPNLEFDQTQDKHFSEWDSKSKKFTLQIAFAK